MLECPYCRESFDPVTTHHTCSNFGPCPVCQVWVYKDVPHACKGAFVSAFASMEAMNDRVACTPFPTNAVEKNVTGRGFATAKQTISLTALTVVYGNEKIPAGSTVYVRGDLCLDGDAKRVFEVEGKSVVFIPISEIKLINRVVWK